ncbi:hypothetical protein CsatA_015161 [Cannabis sativa]
MSDSSNLTLRPLPSSRKHPMTKIDSRRRDDGIIASLMADIGPTRDQMVDRPHEDICKSRVPHHYPEPTYITWPTDTNLEEVIEQVLSPAQGGKGPTQVVVSHDYMELSSCGPSFSGAKKRKACVNVVPVIASEETIVTLGDKTHLSPVTLLPTLEVDTFNPGSCSRDGDSSNRKNHSCGRGRGSIGSRRGAKHGTKSGGSRMVDSGNTLNTGTSSSNLDCNLVNVTILETQNVLSGGEAALIKPPVPMRLLLWNYRGVRRTPATRALRSWVRRHKQECLFLMETKTNEDGIHEVVRLLAYQFSSIIPALGIGGGFALMWNDGVDLEVAKASNGIFEVAIKEPMMKLQLLGFMP